MTTAQTQNIRDLRQWVCWRSEERDGKTTKIPYSPITGRRASSTNPDTWGDYPEAVKARKERDFDGLGFVFTESDPFCGVDLDACVDPRTGEIASWASEIVRELDSYTEYSPSSMGLHVLLRAKLPPGRNRKDRIEIYDRCRNFSPLSAKDAFVRISWSDNRWPTAGRRVARPLALGCSPRTRRLTSRS